MNFKMLNGYDLANSLEKIAAEGPTIFYSGSLSDKIVKGVQKQGGLLTEKDLRSHSSTWQTPVKTDYHGLEIYETAPNSQGPTVLLWLNMLEEYDLSNRYQLDSQELFKVLVDTCILAYEERVKHIGDPAYLELDPKFLTKEFAHELLGARNDHLPRLGQSGIKIQGDTTYFAVGNSEGDCASIIQSNYMGFGSGLVPEGTGIVLNNRGCYFILDEKHHNSLQAGKRTFHTLCACLAEDSSGHTAFALGSMGGDVQPQIHVQLITRMLDYGMDPRSAIDSPRWIMPFSIYERPTSVFLEPGVENKIHLAEEILKARGLSMVRFDSFSSLAGHAQAIKFGQGILSGAADPRGDGAAIGF
jgi:gamma-glutamyltranspeptidase